MTIRDMVPWRRSCLCHRGGAEDRPTHSLEARMDSLHREFDRLIEDMWSSHGTFLRILELPGEVDDSNDAASFRKGVL